MCLLEIILLMVVQVSMILKQVLEMILLIQVLVPVIKMKKLMVVQVTTPYVFMVNKPIGKQQLTLLVLMVLDGKNMLTKMELILMPLMILKFMQKILRVLNLMIFMYRQPQRPQQQTLMKMVMEKLTKSLPKVLEEM